MNITILDKLAFTPEQLARLQKRGQVTQYDDASRLEEAEQRLLELVVGNVESFVADKPKNRVI